MILRHARGELTFDRCRVMGIVNRTPDSFYDGGRMDLNATVSFAKRLLEEGADVLDIGAVKAGPGEDVPVAEELKRLLPAVEAIAATGAIMSVETSRPEVARRAIDAGAAIVNDVQALEDPELCRVCADAGAGLIVMHDGGQRRGRPRHPAYDDVVTEVRAELLHLVDIAVAAGVSTEQLMIDPGLDFGKNTYHSLELMRRLPELVDTGLPVLVAASRKDVVGETLDLPPEERLEGSLALCALSAQAGAAMVRVHDVEASVRAVRMADAVRGLVPPAAPVRGLWE